MEGCAERGCDVCGDVDGGGINDLCRFSFVDEANPVVSFVAVSYLSHL